MSTTMRKSLIIAGALAAGILLVGCQTAIKQGAKVTIPGLGEVTTSPSGETTYKGPTGGEIRVGSEAQLSSNFPSSFPTYSGATVTGSFSSTDRTSSTTGFTVSWETGDDSIMVAKYYRTELKARGWTITQDAESDKATILYFENSAGDNGWVTVSPIEGKTGTEIGLVLTIKHVIE
jgi:hypothetical protein